MLARPSVTHPAPPLLAAAFARALAVTLALGSLACSGARAPARPTIVLVTLDTVRADHLSTYGYARTTDPRLAELARASRVFEVAVPSATWTLPSHVSIFSGLDPAEHGCWKKLDEAEEGDMPAVSGETPLLTGRLRQAGYHQLAAVGGPFVSHRYGLLRDFDEWTDPGEAYERSSAELNRWIFAALERRPREQPLFLFVNYFDAHAPYGAPADRSYPFPEGPRALQVVPPFEPGTTPPPELLRDAQDQYDREILVQDEALGALLDRLEHEGLLANALVIVTADHGEMFGEQPGTYGHGCLPYEPVARVPLVLQRRPGGPVDRVRTPVSLANLPETLLRAAGLEPLAHGGAERVDLLHLPERPPEPYVELRGAAQWFGVLRGERFKYGCALSPERVLPPEGPELLIDLEVDPGEHGSATVEEARRNARARLEGLLRAWSPPPTTMGRAVLEPQELERLRALGYGGQEKD